MKFNLQVPKLQSLYVWTKVTEEQVQETYNIQHKKQGPDHKQNNSPVLPELT